MKSNQSIENLTKKIIAFRDARDWRQFHNPKDVAISLILEASELMEHFQWKNSEEIGEYVVKEKSAIAEEMADVFYLILLLSHDLNVDIIAASYKKLKKNEAKYPVAKAKGNHVKYNRL
ncbi:MAG: nucleotide pyrophosphohydrolase [Patescibacteria group bacterium]